MFDQTPASSSQSESARAARDWVKVLAQYREPGAARSWFEVAVTLGGYAALWAVAWALLAVSPWLALPVAMLNGFLLVRLFTIQHDCGHNAFMPRRETSDWIGRVFGVFTLTPYDVWKKAHAIHHGASGNLGRRGIGDIDTLTIVEYRALSHLGRLKYRFMRNPITLFVIGPAFLFLLENRYPKGFSAPKYWLSAMATNAGIALELGLLWYFGGWDVILWIFLPTSLAAATLGVWLFYVQHQFETTLWDQDQDWNLHEAALYGSSHYVMPAVLQWATANIGIHHVHHLYSRIPFYRLPQVIKDNPELDGINRMTISESFANVRLHLWDEKSRRLVSFKDAARVA